MAVASGGPTRRRYVLILVLLSSVTLITLDQRDQGSAVFDEARRFALDVAEPFQTAADAVVTPVADWLDGVTSAGDLRAERDDLRAEVEELESALARARGALEENEELRTLLDLPFAGELDGITAEVIARSPDSFEQTITLSKGRSSGIAEGMPVVAGDGLVGRVVLASRSSARVLLVTDPSSGVNVRIGNQTGSAEGQRGRDTLRVDFVDPEAQIRDGEVAVTAGESSRFPPGIPVGAVVDAEDRPSAAPDVRLETIVDLAQVEVVTVLVWPV